MMNLCYLEQGILNNWTKLSNNYPQYLCRYFYIHVSRILLER